MPPTCVQYPLSIATLVALRLDMRSEVHATMSFEARLNKRVEVRSGSAHGVCSGVRPEVHVDMVLTCMLGTALGHALGGMY